MSAAIETRGLRKRFRRVEALRGADIEVPEGSVCGFLGPNGAGKSTTMEILMGLIRPSGGWASILGSDLGSDGLDVRSRIGYLLRMHRSSHAPVFVTCFASLRGDTSPVLARRSRTGWTRRSNWSASSRLQTGE